MEHGSRQRQLPGLDEAVLTTKPNTDFRTIEPDDGGWSAAEDDNSRLNRRAYRIACTSSGVGREPNLAILGFAFITVAVLIGWFSSPGSVLSPARTSSTGSSAEPQNCSDGESPAVQCGSLADGGRGLLGFLRDVCSAVDDAAVRLKQDLYSGVAPIRLFAISTSVHWAGVFLRVSDHLAS